MIYKIRNAAMRRHQEREELLKEVQELMEAFKNMSGVDLFPPTLRQTALFLGYVRRNRKSYKDLMRGIEKSLTYRQGKALLGAQADPAAENWKTSAGRAAAELLNDMRM